MKTIEQKALAYDEALERARAINSGKDVDVEAGTTTCEYIFPELKDNDERIRKEIIEYIKTGTYHKDWIAWLEKQGDKPQGKSALEAANEEKVDNANKVEPNYKPKFNIGDWVIWDNKISCHIDNIYQGEESLMYAITDTNNMTRNYSIKDFDNNAHLWTIQDAKDGDVLVSYFNKPFIYNGNHNLKLVGAYGGMATIDEFISASNKCRWTENMNIHPATKEQCELLFQKMEKARYTFDFDKKELKEIEQNSDLSKEDKKNFNDFLSTEKGFEVGYKEDYESCHNDMKKKLIDVINKAAEWWLIHDSYSKDTNNLVNDFKKDLLKYVDTSK